jgi:hypothetical protein
MTTSKMTALLIVWLLLILSWLAFIPRLAGWLGYWRLQRFHKLREVPESDLHEYDIIHMPRSGKCPPGFIIEPRLFAKDGKEYPGCIKASSCGHTAVIIDYLLSGESVSLLLAALPLPSSGEDSPAPDSKSNGGL